MARSYRAREPPPQRGRRDFYFHWRARWSAAAEFGEGLVRRDGGETFARGLALGSSAAADGSDSGPHAVVAGLLTEPRFVDRRSPRSCGKTFRLPRCLAIRGDLRSGRVARSGDRPQHIHFHSRANWRARWRTGSVRVWSAAMAASHSLCGLAWSRSQWIRLSALRCPCGSGNHCSANV